MPTHQFSPTGVANEIRYHNIPVLTYRIAYPLFYATKSSKGLTQINTFYQQLAHQYMDYIHDELLKMAISDFELRLGDKYPFNPYEALQTQEITYNQDCYVSLYTDQYEFTGGAHGNTKRSSQTWNVINGGRLQLADLFPGDQNHLANIKAQITKMAAGRNYFDNYPELIEQTFSPEQFYLTPDAVVFYFQQYDIAPYAAGIPEFAIKYVR